LASAGVTVPDSRLGLIDFIYELSRRLRIWFELDEIEVAGTELVLTADGQLPSPIEVPERYEDRSWCAPFQLADSISREAWNREPMLIYEISEAYRRRVTTHEVENAWHKLLDGLKAEHDDIGRQTDCEYVLWDRIRLMCQI